MTNSLSQSCALGLRTPDLILNRVTSFWFVVAFVGQWIFVAYILGFYVYSAIHGDFEAWNKVLPAGYQEGNFIGNLFLVAHLFIAALISFCGPLQLIPGIRAYRNFHRWNGRLYMVAAFIMAVSGFYLSLSGRNIVGDSFQHVPILMNAVLILVCGYQALRYAIASHISNHRVWALRLFLAVSGVWFFRVGLMFWLVIHGEPVGFSVESFSGPFLSILAFMVYIAPVVFLEIYLRINSKSGSWQKFALAAVMLVLTVITIIGVFGATMGLWLPRVV